MKKQGVELFDNFFWGGIFVGFFLATGVGCTNDEMQEDFYLGVNPSSSSTSSSSSSETQQDDDDDGLSNEVELSFDMATLTADSDYDGFADGLEFVGLSGDPLNSTSSPVPEDRAKTLSSSEILTNQSDSDKDGLGDTFETENNLDPNNPDTDDDGYSDALELVAESDPFLSTSRPTRITAPTSDGTPEGQAPTDSDKDGLSDDVEALNGSEDLAFDSDGDGFSDGIEYLMGSDANDVSVVPAFTVPEPPSSSSSESSESSSE